MKLEDLQKNRTTIRILFWVFLLSTLCLCVFCVFAFLPFGFIDFPCFVGAEDGYLVNEGYIPDGMDESAGALVFITTGMAHASGGGCLSQSLQDGEELDIDPYQLRLAGEQVTIDNDVQLGMGDSTKLEKKRMSLNPWIHYIDYLYLTNEGYVRGEIDHEGNRTEYEEQVLVLIGAAGDRFEINTITAVIFVLSIFGMIGTFILKRLIARSIKKEAVEKPS
ncbi:MAG: hypothetical protein PVF83_07085 [Anaerolineales bacterium]